MGGRMIDWKEENPLRQHRGIAGRNVRTGARSLRRARDLLGK